MAELSVASLRVIHAVIGTGSFTAAAELLGYTQSAVSRQVTAAETAAGAALFVRGARGVTPTPAGLAVGRRALAALSELDAIERDLAGLSDRLAGRVVLGAFPTAQWVLAPRALARLRARHPALAVELQEGSTPVLLRRLRTGRIDVAVVSSGPDLPPVELEDLRVGALPQRGLRVAVARGHRLADAGEVSVGELADEDWIAGTGLQGEPQFGAWPTLVEPRIAWRVREWPARLGLVAAGLGITTIPGIAAEGMPATVVPLRVDDPAWGGRDLLVATRDERSPDVAAVVTALRHVAAALA